MFLLISVNVLTDAENARTMSVGLEERPNLSSVLPSVTSLTEYVTDLSGHLLVARCYLWKGNTFLSLEQDDYAQRARPAIVLSECVQ